MEEEWVVSRAQLRHLLKSHPDWTNQQYAQATSRSLGWVKKWKRRFAQAAEDDETVIYGWSRARKTRPEPLAPEVVERILQIRDQPPPELGRTPGPLAILYYLHARKTSLPRACLSRARPAPSGRFWMPTSVSDVQRVQSGSQLNGLPH
jgi:hypothetical protein